MGDTETPTVVQEPTLDEGFKGAAEVTDQAAPPTTETPATQEAGQGEGTEEVPSTYEEFEQSERHQTLLTEARTAAVEEAKPEILREAKSAAMREFDPSMQRREAQVRSFVDAGQRAVKQFVQLARQTQSGGGDITALQNFADDNTELWRALNGTSYNEGTDWALKQLARASGDPNVLPDLYVRSQNEGLSDEQFAKEFLDRLSDSRLKDRTKALRDEGFAAGKKAAQEAASQKAKADVRKDEGPNLASATAGGSKLPMTYEAYLNRTPEEDGEMSEETHRLMFEEGIRRQAASR